MNTFKQYRWILGGVVALAASGAGTAVWAIRQMPVISRVVVTSVSPAVSPSQDIVQISSTPPPFTAAPTTARPVLAAVPIPSASATLTPAVPSASPSPVGETISAQVAINGTSYAVSLLPQGTVLDALKSLEKQGSITLKLQQTTLGVLVQAINGQENGDQGHYWFFRVNGQFAAKGAGSTPIQAGDQISWEFTQ